ncbi:potassium channel protein [Catenovulum sp. SM1970]|uniref:potassium channel protein n=1 Tax=Marinifaba aquimaris TaxID=2741323 RepID=UPI00157188F2|nr:potassium channel protein [Marinifaba aquimaris]NTS75276.1 potassium channel protein [Marinifaba aquimaris]
MRLSWKSLVFIALGHYAIGYLLCLGLGQGHLVDSWHTYFHFWIVTISTVGYGDLYAEGGAVRVIIDLWFIGLGLGLFGSLLGKTAEFIFHLISRHVQGMKNFHSLDDHIILFCNDQEQAIKSIDLLLADKKRQNRSILFCTTDKEMTHPFYDNSSVEFAKVSSFASDEEMARINLAKACRVIINASSDDENLALTVHVSGLVNEQCHIVTHFDDASYIQSLDRLKLNVECSTSKRVEQLVRASQDHGATAVINQLLDTRDGITLYVLKMPFGQHGQFAQMKQHIYSKTGANVIGVAFDELGKSLELMPNADLALSGDNIYLHYMHSERISFEQIA